MSVDKCYECSCGGEEETDAKAKHEDPRRPPLEEGDCLCDDCYLAAAEELQEELQGEIDELAKKRLEIVEKQIATEFLRRKSPAIVESSLFNVSIGLRPTPKIRRKK